MKEKENPTHGHKTVKFPITPTGQQEKILWEMNDLHAHLFSMAVAEVHYRMNNKESIQSLINQQLQENGFFDLLGNVKDRDLLTKPEKVILNKIMYSGKTNFQALCDWATSVRGGLSVFTKLNAWSMQTTLDRVSGSFASYFELKKRGDTNAKKPTHRNGENMFYAIGWKSCNYQSGIIILPHKLSDIPLKFLVPGYQQKVIENKTIRRIEITREYPEKNIPCRFFMSITYETTIVPIIHIDRVLALDLGSSNIAGIDSRGKTFFQPMRRADKYTQKKLGPLKERRKLLERNSLEYKLLQEKIRKIERRQHNQMKDFQRKLAYTLIQSFDCIIIGITNVRLGLAQSDDGSAKQHRGVQNTGTLSRLKQTITNKAKEFGKTVILVPDVELVEKIPGTHHKIIMAAEHFYLGLDNISDWEDDRRTKTIAIVQKSLERKPKRFL